METNRQLIEAIENNKLSDYLLSVLISSREMIEPACKKALEVVLREEDLSEELIQTILFKPVALINNNSRIIFSLGDKVYRVPLIYYLVMSMLSLG